MTPEEAVEAIRIAVGDFLEHSDTDNPHLGATRVLSRIIGILEQVDEGGRC